MPVMRTIGSRFDRLRAVFAKTGTSLPAPAQDPLAEEAVSAALATCIDCGDTCACAEWISEAPATKAAPEFCGNRDLIADLHKD